MNILYIGSSGPLSLIPFKRLLSTEHKIIAVGVNKPVILNGKVIAVENESLALAASHENIPLLDLSQSVELLIEECQRFSIDIILMSCYCKRLPDELINLAVRGCFNLHPSILPGYRGPEPIFWQMKAASIPGVSWHKVVHDFDAGDVVAEKRVITNEGNSYLEINLQLAESGADLMQDLLNDLSNGELHSNPQSIDMASYYPYPQQKDFVIEDNWTAQRAFNFMRATRIFDMAYRCRMGKYCYLLVDALEYDNNTSIDAAVIQPDRLSDGTSGRVNIPCTEGVLIATYTDRISN